VASVKEEVQFTKLVVTFSKKEVQFRKRVVTFSKEEVQLRKLAAIPDEFVTA